MATYQGPALALQRPAKHVLPRGGDRAILQRRAPYRHVARECVRHAAARRASSRGAVGDRAAHDLDRRVLGVERATVCGSDANARPFGKGANTRGASWTPRARTIMGRAGGGAVGDERVGQRQPCAWEHVGCATLGERPGFGHPCDA